MFQREVGEKIIANVNSKNYSRLSIITKSRLKVLNYFYVSKNSFFPRPKVDSMVIEFEPIQAKNLILKSLDSLEFITKIFFSGRRKMINKAFKKIKINFDPIIKELKIDLKLRPERLDEKIYFKIAQFYEEMSGKKLIFLFMFFYNFFNLVKTGFKIIIYNNIIIVMPMLNITFILF